MATERVTERTDGVTAERTVERDAGGTTYVERRSGSGATGLLVAVALIALVAIVAWFLLNANQQEAAETAAISGAAESVAESAEGAANSVADAAKSVTE